MNVAEQLLQVRVSNLMDEGWLFGSAVAQARLDLGMPPVTFGVRREPVQLHIAPPMSAYERRMRRRFGANYQRRLG